MKLTGTKAIEAAKKYDISIYAAEENETIGFEYAQDLIEEDPNLVYVEFDPKEVVTIKRLIKRVNEGQLIQGAFLESMSGGTITLRKSETECWADGEINSEINATELWEKWVENAF